MRILVVDDEFQVLKSARSLLRDHETYIASDSSSAIRVARRHQPDAILLDLALGGESGLEAIEPLLNASPDSAVIVMTGLASEDMMRLAYANGADAFVPKYALGSIPAVLADLFSEEVGLSEP